MEGEIDKKKAKIVILGGVACVFVIIMIAVLASFLGQREDSIIKNQDEIAEEESNNMTDQAYGEVSDVLFGLLESNYEVTEKSSVDANIRSSSYVTKEQTEDASYISFLLDVDSSQVTYEINLLYNHKTGEITEIHVDCPAPAVSKYPATFCIGLENSSTIDSTIVSSLPHTSYRNGEKTWELSKIGGTTFITLKVYTSCDDNALHEQMVAEARAWVNGQVPEQELPIEEQEFSKTCEAMDYGEGP